MKKGRAVSALALVLCAGIGGHVLLQERTGTLSPASAADNQDHLTLTINHHRHLGGRQGEAGSVGRAAGANGWGVASSTSSEPTTSTNPTAVEQSGSSTQSVTLPDNTQASGNWAGYITAPANGQRYTSVSGSWTVPNISGSSDGMAAQWIGLGGVYSQDLLQMGTIEQVVNGQVEAQVFWEKLPASAQNIMTVPIGTKMDAEISKLSGDTWNVHFTATTPSGQTLTKNLSVTLSADYELNIGTSAEWISEDPSNDQNQLYPLANTGTVQFNSALVDGQPISAAGNKVQPVALVTNSGNVLIAPSALGSDGQSFTTTTLGTSQGENSAISQIGQRGRGFGTWRHRGWSVAEGWSGSGGYSVGYTYVTVHGFRGWR